MKIEKFVLSVGWLLGRCIYARKLHVRLVVSYIVSVSWRRRAHISSAITSKVHCVHTGPGLFVYSPSSSIIPSLDSFLQVVFSMCLLGTHEILQCGIGLQRGVGTPQSVNPSSQLIWSPKGEGSTPQSATSFRFQKQYFQFVFNPFCESHSITQLVFGENVKIGESC